MQLWKAFAEVLSLSRIEKYVPPESEFIKETGVSEDSYLAFEVRFYGYRRWRTAFMLIVVAVVVPLALVLELVLVTGTVMIIGQQGQNGVLFLPIVLIMGLIIPICFAAALAGLLVAILEPAFLRIPMVAHARVAYVRFIWSHRQLVRAVVEYNKAHPDIPGVV